MTPKEEILRDTFSGLLGGTIAATLLVAEHKFMRRESLPRTYAYIAGVAALDVGALVYWQANKKKASPLGAAIVQLLGGMAVIVAYRRDKESDKGQLQEALNQAALANEAAYKAMEETANYRTRVAELEKELATRPVKLGEIATLYANLHGITEDAGKVVHVSQTMKVYVKNWLDRAEVESKAKHTPKEYRKV